MKMTQFAKDVADRPAPQEILGFLHYAGWLTPAEQSALLDDLRALIAASPLFSPVTPSGKPMSVRMTSAGDLGWVADRRGYRYGATHPNGSPWPAIPQRVLDIWRAVVPQARDPQSCLVNYYPPDAKMGLHQDRDEADFSQPVLSISLGDDGLFRIGGLTRGGPTQSLWLRSGDVMVMGGDARLRFHGIDKIADGTSPLMPKGGRVNLTLRVVT